MSVSTTVRSPKLAKGSRSFLEKSIGWFTIIAAVGVWQLLSASGVLASDVIPSAFDVIRELVSLLVTKTYWLDIWATVYSALVGLLLVLCIGTVAALLIGMLRPVDRSTWFVIEFLKPVPPIALIPLGLLLWGPSPTMKIVLITFGAMWPFLTQMVYGVRQTNNVALDMAASYRLGWRQTAQSVVLPALVPYALTGLRISASIAIIVSVVTELVGGANGVGQTIAVSQANGVIDTMYAYIITAGLLGVAVNVAFGLLEKPLLFWHPSQRGESN